MEILKLRFKKQHHPLILANAKTLSKKLLSYRKKWQNYLMKWSTLLLLFDISCLVTTDSINLAKEIIFTKIANCCGGSWGNLKLLEEQVLLYPSNHNSKHGLRPLKTVPRKKPATGYQITIKAQTGTGGKLSVLASLKMSFNVLLDFSSLNLLVLVFCHLVCNLFQHFCFFQLEGAASSYNLYS